MRPSGPFLPSGLLADLASCRASGRAGAVIKTGVATRPSPASWHQTRPGSPNPAQHAQTANRVLLMAASGATNSPQPWPPPPPSRLFFLSPPSLPRPLPFQTAFWPFLPAEGKEEKAPQGRKETQTQGTAQRITRIFPSFPSFSLILFYSPACPPFPSVLTSRLRRPSCAADWFKGPV